MNCISINHKTASRSIREKFSFSAEEKEYFEKIAIEDEHIYACVAVSTCNRSEVYFTGDKYSISSIMNLLNNCKEADADELKKYCSVYCNDNAIVHLFKVITGMESMVIGEDEILGQLRDAYLCSLGSGHSDHEMNIIFKGAITCAKKIKTDTKIRKTPVSVGTIAANLIFDYEKEKRMVLIIGISGKMGTIIMKNVISKADPNIKIIGTTRNHNKEFDITYKDVEIVDYRDRYKYIDEADIIISATKSPHYTIISSEMQKYIKTDKKRLFVDLAVPADIDEDIKRNEKNTLYDIDYFEELSKNNNEIKMREIEKSKCIIDEYLDKTLKEVQFHTFLPEIDRVKEIIYSQNFEKTLYHIRDNSNHEEFRNFINILKKL